MENDLNPGHRTKRIYQTFLSNLIWKFSTSSAVTSYVAGIDTFEIKTWLNLRDRDCIQNPETRDLKIYAFWRIKKKLSSSLPR